MKKLIIAIVICPFFLMFCEKTVIDPYDYPQIQGDIDDIILDEGIGEYSINLDESFKVKDEPGAVINHRVEFISDPTLIFAQVDGSQLILKIITGQTGSSTITLRSQTAEVYKTTTFTIEVNAITAELALERAEDYFLNAEYDLALSHFSLLAQKAETSLCSDAYMGMGYCLMRLNDKESDYGYGAFELSISFNSDNMDARAGLSLLEYAWKKNFNQAIYQGKIVLENNPDYVFKYDNSIDKNDILLNIALSQYSALLYHACLSTVKELDPDYDLESSDDDFEIKLQQKLQELIETYS